MSWGAGVDHGTAMAAAQGEEEEAKRPQAAEELLEAVRLAEVTTEALATAQLVALRLTAEGNVGASQVEDVKEMM